MRHRANGRPGVDAHIGKLNHRMKTDLGFPARLVRRSMLAWAATVSAVLLFGTGCGSTKVTTQNQASVGQQLMDLEKSYKEGVITEKEYQKLKRRIVKDND